MVTGRRRAAFFEKKGDRVQCTLCPLECTLRPAQFGACRVRKNEGGELRTLNYGAVSAMAVDPVEKKPLYHFYPGHRILSLGSYGCNLGCDFCQNWELSQAHPPTRFVAPGEVLQTLAGESADCIGVAYTYSEPLVWYEYVLETAREVAAAGYKNVLVTNGFVNEGPLKALSPYFHAANVDVKGFGRDFYNRVCRGFLEPVKQTVELLARAGVHTEVTTLVIPGVNDDESRLRALFEWLAGLAGGLPLHVNRYFPDYKRTTPPTPAAELQQVAEVAREYLDHVYIGSLSFGNASETRCGNCGAVLVQRTGYAVRTPTATVDGTCGQCGAAAPFVGVAHERLL